MDRDLLGHLPVILAVARRKSFVGAASELGMGASAVSHSVRLVEERLGVPLFARTTRSVALTEAGDRLLAEVQPILEGLDHALESVNLFRDKPVGTLRLAVARPFATMLVAPLIRPFLAEYPDIRLEVSVDDTHGDIVKAGFDAGIRLGDRVERDMTILRISDDLRMVAVAAPSYLERRPRPSVPKDLHDHRCIGYRSPRDGQLFPWVFARGDERIEVAVEGPLVVNDPDLLTSAILDGVGVGYLPEQMVASHLAQGRLVRLLEDWGHVLPGVYLFHPSRRQTPMPLQVFLRFAEKWRRRPQAAGFSLGLAERDGRGAVATYPQLGLRRTDPGRHGVRLSSPEPTSRNAEPAASTLP